MAEIVPVIFAGSSKGIKHTIKELTNKKYPFEGKVRKGFCSPFPYEIKLYGFKIKDECVPAFLGDLKGLTLIPDLDVPRPANRVLKKAVGAVSFIVSCQELMFRLKRLWNVYITKKWSKNHYNFPNRLEKIDMTKIKPTGHSLGAWVYCMPFGVMTDYRNEKNEDVL